MRKLQLKPWRIPGCEQSIILKIQTEYVIITRVKGKNGNTNIRIFWFVKWQ